MSQIIPFTISQVSSVSVAAINASGATTNFTGGGNYLFAGLVLSETGEPNTVYAVDGDNFTKVLGKASHPVKGVSAMSMRYLKEAVGVGRGYVIPVVGSDAKRPVIGIKAPAIESDALTAVARVMPFGGDISTEADEILAIYPTDGDVTNRTISIKPIDGKAGFYTLKLVKSSPNGTLDIQLNEIVSFDPEAVNEFDSSAYIADVLNSSRRASISFSVDFDESKFTQLDDVQFTGGTRGNLNTLEPSDYQQAITVLRNFPSAYQAVLPLGILDPVVIKDLQGVARDRRIDAFFDVPPTLNYESALEWMITSGFESQESAFYHFPYKATDLFFSGAKSVWGISSIAYGAKLKGIQSVSASVGGYHFSPAGTERGAITRSGVEPLPNLGEPNYELMVEARINKIGTDGGKLIIDDALTATSSSTYLRFQHVVSLINSISRRFYQAAIKLKHQPDGITISALDGVLRAIGEDYFAVGALVKPRKEEDGEQPFQWNIVQKDLDLLEVTFYACPTGSSRRIAGVPIVLK